MSLEEVIAARKAKAMAYEEYLKRIAELVKKVEQGIEESTPEPLKKSPALRALYNNLKARGTASMKVEWVAEKGAEYSVSGDPTLALAQRLEEAVKRVRPDGWRGVQAREKVIKAAIYEVLQDEGEVERLFLIIKAQSEY